MQYKYIAMGITKTEHFTDEQNELATLAKAIGHPARIAIIQHLIKVNSCMCGDIILLCEISSLQIRDYRKDEYSCIS